MEVVAGHAMEQASADENGRSTTLNILFIDDHRDTAETLATLMCAAGHRVRTCYSPQDAFDVARDQSPDVVLLDIGMPCMDGYAVLRGLRDQPETAHARIVAVTGHGLPADRERIKVAGFDAHILKPYDINDLIEAM